MDQDITNKASQLFRELRQEHNLSVAQLGSGIVSPSTINKFEAGKSQPSFFNLSNLLKRMAINLDDFYDQVEGNSLLTSYRKFLDSFEKFYQENDLPTLKKIRQEKTEGYLKQADFDHLIQAATASSLTNGISQENTCDPIVQTAIRDYLMKIKHWNQLEISIFNNCLFLLTDQMIQAITTELLQSEQVTVTTLINIVDFFYEQQNYQQANKLLVQVQKLPINQNDLITRFKVQFMTNLLTLNELSARKQNQQLINHTLRSLGSNSLASSFEVYMTKYPFPKTTYYIPQRVCF